MGAAWGVAALWLATFCSEHALWMSPRLRWFVILSLIVGVATAVYWLIRYSVRNILHVYPRSWRSGRTAQPVRAAAAIRAMTGAAPTHLKE
jgi:hypothetical protein